MALNTLRPEASQAYVNQILIPPAVAWGFQLVAGGIATARAWHFIFPRRTRARIGSIQLIGDENRRERRKVVVTVGGGGGGGGVLGSPGSGSGNKDEDRRERAFEVYQKQQQQQQQQRQTLRRGPQSSVPYARTLLALACFSNVVTIFVVWWSAAEFIVNQDRSYLKLAQTRACRSLAPIPIAFTAAFTQTFMSIRCWRLANRNKLFGVVVFVLILLSLGGGVGFACLLLLGRPLKNWASLLTPQLFTWSSLTVDTVITAVSVAHLLKKKQDGLPRRAEDLINNLVRIAFETCAIPWFAVLTSAVCGAVAFTHPLPILRATYWALGAMSPSLYLLSFTYCLQATMRRLKVDGMYSDDDSLEDSPRIGFSPSPGGGGRGQAAGGPHHQCLCAHVRPFVNEFNSPPSSTTKDTTSTWEAPKEWQSVDYGAASLTPHQQQRHSQIQQHAGYSVGRVHHMTREISYEQDGRGGGGDDDDDRIYNESSAWSLGITQPPPRARLRRQEIVSMPILPMRD